jgi:hypothetical protein
MSHRPAPAPSLDRGLDQPAHRRRDKLFGHLGGSAVQPMRDRLTKHLDGNSHSTYVAGWRADLEVTPSKQLRLPLFNEERWLIPG